MQPRKTCTIYTRKTRNKGSSVYICVIKVQPYTQKKIRELAKRQQHHNNTPAHTSPKETTPNKAKRKEEKE